MAFSVDFAFANSGGRDCRMIFRGNHVDNNDLKGSLSTPLSLFIDTHNTGKVDAQKIAVAIRERFDLSPGKMIEHLKLRKPIYSKTSAYGHFGRKDPDFTWEALDCVDYFKRLLK